MCRKVIALESTPSHGNKEVAEFIGHSCESQGFYVTYQNETLNGLEQLNVIIRPQKEQPKEEFLLQTHLDTVDPGNFATWTRTQSNPFNATIYDGRIYGLGSADTKLDFLCKIEAAREFLNKPMRVPYVLVGTFGAQNSMAGAVKLVRRKTISAKAALIGEPSSLELIHAGPGLAVVEISIPFSEEEIEYRAKHDLMESSSTQSRMFSGRAAHSSNPDMGENAIVKMLDYLTQLPEGLAIMDLDGGINYNSVPSSAVVEMDVVGGLREPIVPKLSRIMTSLKSLEKKFKNLNDKGFSPAHPTMNIGIIRTYDDQVRMTGSCRLTPSVTDEIYEVWMAELKEACSAVGATFRVRDYKKSFYTEEASPFSRLCLETMKSLGLKASVTKTAVSTEASVFSRLGVECLIFGPGQSVGNSHAPNESISMEDLSVATNFYRQVIERICL